MPDGRRDSSDVSQDTPFGFRGLDFYLNVPVHFWSLPLLYAEESLIVLPARDFEAFG